MFRERLQGHSESHRRAAAGEEGQALVEYALILFLVALVTVGSLSAIGVSVSGAINAMAAGL
jgi:Flp pilus assembly pilin Flp